MLRAQWGRLHPFETRSWPANRLECGASSLRNEFLEFKRKKEVLSSVQPLRLLRLCPAIHMSRSLFVWWKVIFRIMSLLESYLVGDWRKCGMCVCDVCTEQGGCCASERQNFISSPIFGIICYLWCAPHYYYYHSALGECVQSVVGVSVPLSVCDCVIYMNINELTSWHKYSGVCCGAAVPLQRSSCASALCARYYFRINYT